MTCSAFALFFKLEDAWLEFLRASYLYVSWLLCYFCAIFFGCTKETNCMTGRLISCQTCWSFFILFEYVGDVLPEFCTVICWLVTSIRTLGLAVKFRLASSEGDLLLGVLLTVLLSVATNRYLDRRPCSNEGLSLESMRRIKVLWLPIVFLTWPRSIWC